MLSSLTFATPLVLGALLALPLLWWLLRLVPPRPQTQQFPPTRLLAEIAKKEDTPHATPWWLLLLRLGLAALAIIALAGPLWQATQTGVTSAKNLVVIIDNGWTTSRDWQKRVAAANEILTEAVRAGRPTALVMTTEQENQDVRFEDAASALEKLGAQSPLPYPEDRATTAARLAKAEEALKEAHVVWLASNLKTAGDETLKTALTAAESVTIRHDVTPSVAITEAKNGAAGLEVAIKRLSATTPELLLRALDKDNISLSDIPVTFEGDALLGKAAITLPIELRNEIVKLVLVDEARQPIQNIGATYLIDDRTRRRSVGLLSGVSSDQAQPLLSPLYYITRALAPFADLRETPTANLTEAIPSLLQSGVSMVVMADVGTLPKSETERLQKFMSLGGTIVRFAGPRLAASEDELTPVRLRQGERNLGGSLTWEEPQRLARFSESGPFAGMALPDDIVVRRQVLAEPDFDLLKRTWAELEDGTPLVTARPVGKGWLILFHVTADATWSNLPISGAFVDMLVKLVAFSSVPAGATVENAGDVQVFPPFKTLDAFARLTPPLETAEAISIDKLDSVIASATNPPGFYGKAESLIAHNLMRADTPFETLTPAELLPNATLAPIGESTATDLRAFFFTAAALLLLLDGVIVAYMAGLFSKTGLLKRARIQTASMFLAAGIIAFGTSENVFAQTKPETPFELSFNTHLAYVVTGDEAIDSISKAGLTGLTTFLRDRTALEPGDPVGVDISKDELAFFPLLYWPISDKTRVPEPATMARIDAFMKQGGTVLFDTRDQLDAGFNNATPATLRLREITSNLDIPPLEPVPANHVLTRAFYLLQDFPGRWIGSPLWVEANDDKNKGDEETQSQADGVSSVIITANDLAGAWAVAANGSHLLPTVPNDPRQRVFAYRTGANIVMYTLTGNYKADQVHIPALLERLGQ